jgi:hypothetical protein
MVFVNNAPVHKYRIELYPHFGQLSGIKDEFGNDQQFPAACRKTRRLLPHTEGDRKNRKGRGREAMIRTDREYEDAKKRLEDDLEVMEKQRSRMKELGLSEGDIDNAMEPAFSFHQQLKEEVEWCHYIIFIPLFLCHPFEQVPIA